MQTYLIIIIMTFNYHYHNTINYHYHYLICNQYHYPLYYSTAHVYFAFYTPPWLEWPDGGQKLLPFLTFFPLLTHASIFC